MANDSDPIMKAANEYFDSLVKSRFIELFGDPLISPKYNQVPFMECLEFNPGKTEVKGFSDDTIVSFVPMESVNTDGTMDSSQTRPLGEVRKGYTYFKNNDVVFAKITPCFENGKVAIAKKCVNGIGFGSTEFHVARPIKGISNSIWLQTLLQLDSLRHLASGNMSGTAGQKRVQKPFFDKLTVGLPPIELQNQFATFVQQVDKSKLAFQQLVSRFDELVKSRFIELFEGNQYPLKPLKELFKTSSGGTPLKSNKSYYDNGTIPWLTSGEVNADHIVSARSNITQKALDETSAKIPPINSVLVSMYGSIGYAGILEFEAAINQAICAIHPNPNYSPEWVCYYIRSKKKELTQQGVGAALTNISQDKIRKLLVPVVPLEQQQVFSSFVKQVDKSKSEIIEGLKRLTVVNNSQQDDTRA